MHMIRTKDSVNSFPNSLLSVKKHTNTILIESSITFCQLAAALFTSYNFLISPCCHFVLPCNVNKTVSEK